MPTNTAGGYIAGYRADPTDRLPRTGLTRKRFVAGTPGSIKNSIWASMTMVITARELDNRLYYTSPGSDLREYSPGSFFLVIDGDVNQAGSLSVSIDYDVTCSQPALDYQVDEEQFPATLFTEQRMYGHDGQTEWKGLEDPGSTPATWDYVFKSIPRPSFDVVFSGNQYGVKTSAEEATDIEYTSYIQFDSVNDGFYAVIPDTADITSGIVKTWERVPFRSPNGNIQVYQQFQTVQVYAPSEQSENS